MTMPNIDAAVNSGAEGITVEANAPWKMKYSAAKPAMSGRPM